MPIISLQDETEMESFWAETATRKHKVRILFVFLAGVAWLHLLLLKWMHCITSLIPHEAWPSWCQSCVQDGLGQRIPDDEPQIEWKRLSLIWGLIVSLQSILLTFVIYFCSFIPSYKVSNVISALVNAARIDRSGPRLPPDTGSSNSNSVPVNHSELQATQNLTGAP